MSSALPTDYAERVYAGVLGKIIGVYLGRPFEGWTNERIVRELGEVDYYVNARLGRPLVVTDDDISGTFTFVRAFADYGDDPDLTARQIGETWLNYLIEPKTILWWGGMGNSTEHTAYRRLRDGVPAPESGSVARNGRVVAEQIGAQIFIDGWAMLCPGDPERAADYARRAASVSHDGEAIYGAQVVAAMEAGAFVERDLTKLTDEALRRIPANSIIARQIADLREWQAADDDWRRTLRRVQERYGYDRYGGNCHMVPNHALIHLALLYGGGDFDRSLMIVNTAGWDTDCNSGNVGCLLGIRDGLAAFAGARDWRGPVADRILLSSADGGRSVTDAVLETRHLVRTARALRGEPPAPPTKFLPFHSEFVTEPEAAERDAHPPSDGVRFAFELPGSVQGWQAEPGSEDLSLENVVSDSATGRRSLALRFAALGPGEVLRASTATFVPPDALDRAGYSLQASPTLYGGQTVRARVEADAGIAALLAVRLFVRAYGDGPLANTGATLEYGPITDLPAGEMRALAWTLPPGNGAPIYKIGLELAAACPIAAGVVYLDCLGWAGAPTIHWQRAAAAWPASVRAWVAGADAFAARTDALAHVVQNQGRGLVITGLRSWTNYTVSATVRLHMASEGGIAARVQGMERYYALLLTPEGRLRLIKRAPGEGSDGGLGERILAERATVIRLDHPYRLALRAAGGLLVASVDSAEVFRVTDATPLLEGAIALVVADGRMDVDEAAVGRNPDDESPG